jgi:hypothetical protein
MPATPGFVNTSGYRISLLFITLSLCLSACSGLDVTADGTDVFAATRYTRYAWRSEPPSRASPGKDMTTIKSPSIRAGVEEKMATLGYELVDRANAEFLLEYFAAPGFNDGRLLSGGSNDLLYGSSVNRHIDGATADNAHALSGPVETGKIRLVFIDAQTVEMLWHVQVSMVVENSNRIDHDAVRKAVGEAISMLPPAS